MMNSKKVYCIDSSFAHRLGFNFSENKGRILENIVYLELLRRGKEVYYHSGKNECDFVVKEGLNVVQAVQVSLQIDLLNYDRELKGLLEAIEIYNLKQGLLLTNDIEEQFTPKDERIKVMTIWEWLLIK